MANYQLSPDAERDYFEILDYTLETWGIEQFKTYGALLKEAIIRLSAS